MERWTKVDGFDVCTNEEGRVTRVTLVDKGTGKIYEHVPIRWNKTHKKWEEVEDVKISTLRTGYSRGGWDFRGKDYKEKEDKSETIRKSKTYTSMVEYVAELKRKYEARQKTAEERAREQGEKGNKFGEGYSQGIKMVCQDTIYELEALQSLLDSWPSFE